MAGRHLLQPATQRAQGLSVAEEPRLGGRHVHRFHRFKDQVDALLQYPKTAAGPGFAQLDASALIGCHHYLRIGHGISPKWVQPIIGLAGDGLRGLGLRRGWHQPASMSPFDGGASLARGQPHLWL